MSDAAALRARRRHALFARLAERPAVMGILNVTPDSFSDGGRFMATEAALAQARKLVADGADILDVGAESTRPGSEPVSLDEEWRRLEAVLAPLLREIDAPLSVDTSKAEIARRALALGVCMVNDVGGLQHDPDMARVAAEAGAAAAAMYARPEMDWERDVVADMEAFFDRTLAIAAEAGLPRAHVLLDPGLGFAKSRAQNHAALAATPRLSARYGLPVLIGVSRKRLFGDLSQGRCDDALIGTLAANLAALGRGARMFRVHDVAEHATALKVFEMIDHA